MQILFCLPGNKFPKKGLFGMLHFDKIVHVILFSVFVVVWCYYLHTKALQQQKLKTVFFFVFLIAAINGIVIEYIQSYFIPFRTFDQGDIIADLIGAAVAYGICNVKLLTC